MWNKRSKIVYTSGVFDLFYKGHDLIAVTNYGLSDAPKAQLFGRTNKELVDADIARQMEKSDDEGGCN